MLQRLLNVLNGSQPPVIASGEKELELAVAALLVEAARMDDVFGAEERAAIEGLLARRFELSAADVAALVDQAQLKLESSAQYFPYTSRITRELECEQRAEIIELLWRVAFSDGVLDPQEDMLIRQIAGLIHVPDRERGLARQRALADLKRES